MKFQILISTVNNNYNLEKYKYFYYLIINQLLDLNMECKSKNKHILCFYEKGLSKSRNCAIKYSDADICLISDDDVIYKEDIDKVIISIFKKYQDVDIITFQIETPEGELYKNYKNNIYMHNKKSIMGVSSIEIVFRRKSIVDNKLYFDELFGLGSVFPTGEEVIFLADALDKGLKILYVPIPIVQHPKESSGKNYDKRELIMAKGAMFYRIFGNFAYIIIFIFAFKKFKLSKKYNYFKFMKYLFKGIQQYKKRLDK